MVVGVPTLGKSHIISHVKLCVEMKHFKFENAHSLKVKHDITCKISIISSIQSEQLNNCNM